MLPLGGTAATSSHNACLRISVSLLLHAPDCKRLEILNYTLRLHPHRHSFVPRKHDPCEGSRQGAVKATSCAGEKARIRHTQHVMCVTEGVPRLRWHSLPGGGGGEELTPVNPSGRSIFTPLRPRPRNVDCSTVRSSVESPARRGGRQQRADRPVLSHGGRLWRLLEATTAATSTQQSRPSANPDHFLKL